MSVSKEDLEQRVYTAFANVLSELNVGLYQGALERKWQVIEALPDSLQDESRLGIVTDIFAKYEEALVQCDDAEIRAQVEQQMIAEMEKNMKRCGVPARDASAVVQCLYLQQLAVNYSHVLYLDHTADSEDLEDAEGLEREKEGLHTLLCSAVARFGELASNVAEALVDRHAQDVRSTIDMQRAELSQQEDTYEIPDTGWYDRYQPLIQDILDATREARHSLYKIDTIEQAHERLKAMQARFSVPQDEGEKVTEQTREWMFRNARVDPEQLRAYITSSAPHMAKALHEGDAVITDLILVSGLEVMMHGLTQTIIAQYCDSKTLKPQHIEAEKGMRTEFLSMLKHLGIGAHAAEVLVTRFSQAVHAATQHEIGLDEPNHYARLN